VLTVLSCLNRLPVLKKDITCCQVTAAFDCCFLGFVVGNGSIVEVLFDHFQLFESSAKEYPPIDNHLFLSFKNNIDCAAFFLQMLFDLFDPVNFLSFLYLNILEGDLLFNPFFQQLCLHQLDISVLRLNDLLQLFIVGLEHFLDNMFLVNLQAFFCLK
jgi:hypothetical protein